MKFTRGLASVIVLTALAGGIEAQAGAPTTAAAGDWPQFRGPNRDGHSAETGLLARWPEGGPKLLWSATGIGSGFSHVAVADGLIYVTGLVGKDGLLRAYTLDGKLKWQANYGPEWTGAHPGARCTPIIHDGLLYVASGAGNVACFNAADGRSVWTVKAFDLYDAPQIKYGWAESLLIDGDNLICTPCGRKGTMLALNRKTGRQVWVSSALGHKSSFCSPLLVEHGKTRMIVTMTDAAVVAFSPTDGELLWQHPYRNSRGNHPITPIYQSVHEKPSSSLPSLPGRGQGEGQPPENRTSPAGLLYVTSGYGKGAIGLALAPHGGGVKQLWEQPRQDTCHGQAVLVDGYVYGSSHQSSGLWSCLDLKTGKLAWESAGVGRGGSVIFADGLLYCYAEDGTVGLVRPDPKSCQVVSSFKVSAGSGPHWAHPVVAAGRLFIRHGEVLLCYDIAAESPAPHPGQ